MFAWRNVAFFPIIVVFLLASSGAEPDLKNKIVYVQLGMNVSDFKKINKRQLDELPSLRASLASGLVEIEEPHDLALALRGNRSSGSLVIPNLGGGRAGATNIAFIPKIDTSSGEETPYAQWEMDNVLVYLGTKLTLGEAYAKCVDAIALLERHGWRGTTQEYMYKNAKYLGYSSVNEMWEYIKKDPWEVGVSVDERQMGGYAGTCGLRSNTFMLLDVDRSNPDRAPANDPDSHVFMSTLSFAKTDDYY